MIVVVCSSTMHGPEKVADAETVAVKDGRIHQAAVTMEVDLPPAGLSLARRLKSP